VNAADAAAELLQFMDDWLAADYGAAGALPARLMGTSRSPVAG
jgi:hypothetical protein